MTVAKIVIIIVLAAVRSLVPTPIEQPKRFEKKREKNQAWKCNKSAEKGHNIFRNYTQFGHFNDDINPLYYLKTRI